MEPSKGESAARHDFFQQLKNSLNLVLRTFAVFLVICGLYSLEGQLDYLLYVFSSPENVRVGLLEVMIILGIVVCFAAGAQMWRQKKSGWYLSVAALTHFIIRSLFDVLLTWKLLQSAGNLLAIIAAMAFCAAAIYFLNRPPVSLRFHITPIDRIVTFGLVVIYSTAANYCLYFL